MRPLKIEQLNEKLKGLKLEVGNPEHLRLRDEFEVAAVAERLREIVTECPECSYHWLELYDVDLENKTAKWHVEMNCHPDIMTDLEGNFLEHLS